MLRSHSCEDPRKSHYCIWMAEQAGRIQFCNHCLALVLLPSAATQWGERHGRAATRWGCSLAGAAVDAPAFHAELHRRIRSAVNCATFDQRSVYQVRSGSGLRCWLLVALVHPPRVALIPVPVDERARPLRDSVVVAGRSAKRCYQLARACVHGTTGTSGGDPDGSTHIVNRGGLCFELSRFGAPYSPGPGSFPAPE